MMHYFSQQFIFSVLFLFALPFTTTAQNPLKIGVIGLSHDHVHWVFASEERGDISIAGIVEPNKELAQRFAQQYNFSMDLVYSTSEELLKAKELEAVSAFGPVYDHLQVVETFAPKGIHVMVEKPLAANLQQARQMKKLADENNIHLLTNYETTWYPTNHKAYKLVKEDSVIGAIRKIIIRDGHKGPKKIGVSDEFLDWLTDPKLNGGGAITDFGCYGANLTTWLMEGTKPNAVTAVTQQLQPENNPNVDDEAILILQYDETVALLQASWNWPLGRKDMEIYGLDGIIYAENRHDFRIRMAEESGNFNKATERLRERQPPYNDPFLYLTAVIRNQTKIAPYALSSLENNMIVMEILDAAVKSAKTGQTIQLNKK